MLGLALDGPRAGPIGEAIVTRLARWWPGVTEWQADLYAQLGRWQPTEELAQTLQLVLQGDSNQLVASSNSMTRGLPINDRAMVTRWLSPPDKTDPLAPTIVIMPMGMALISSSISALRAACHTSSTEVFS